MQEALASFVRLSGALVGDDQLPGDLAAAYFEHAWTALADELPALLARFADLLQAGIDPVTALRQHLLPDSRFGPPSKVILALWFNGGIKTAAGDWAPASADSYYRALVWDVIGAHPPTLSNGYFGHWKYPPEC
jgi:Membrane bound FAD containing D-sorbitol dehydrogenase